MTLDEYFAVAELYERPDDDWVMIRPDPDLDSDKNRWAAAVFWAGFRDDIITIYPDPRYLQAPVKDTK